MSSQLDDDLLHYPLNGLAIYQQYSSYKQHYILKQLGTCLTNVQYFMQVTIGTYCSMSSTCIQVYGRSFKTLMQVMFYVSTVKSFGKHQKIFTEWIIIYKMQLTCRKAQIHVELRKLENHSSKKKKNIWRPALSHILLHVHVGNYTFMIANLKRATIS